MNLVNNLQPIVNLQHIVNSFTNKKLKKIVHVYQLKYTNNKKGSPGLGDFLRGSFCFLQLSKLLNLEFEIDVSNHPISKYIENSLPIKDINYDNVFWYEETNKNIKNDIVYKPNQLNINKDFLDKTIQLFNSMKNVETFGFCSNAFEPFNTYTQEGKHLINSKLQPNQLMNEYIDNTLNNLGLSKKMYRVIHIRTGDKYLVDGEKMNIQFINKIQNILKNIIIPGRRYLIISDSNCLKSHLNIFPNIYMLFKNINHLGGEALKSHNSDGIMNTMLEYNLMSFSNQIISLSVYGHVSGFSKYCGILNNIPFYNIKI